MSGAKVVVYEGSKILDTNQIVIHTEVMGQKIARKTADKAHRHVVSGCINNTADKKACGRSKVVLQSTV